MITKTQELIDLELIDDNPWQPRLAMDIGGVESLADDMDQIGGMLQPPLGRWVNGRIQLAHGHRRVAACRIRAKRGTGPWQIEMETAELTDEEMVFIALSENVERKQLTDIEVVRAHKRAIAETSVTIQGLADKIGVDRATLSNNLRVLDLPDFVLEHVKRGDMVMSAAREFLVLQHGDPDDGGHVHTEDMHCVVRDISSVSGRRGMPDWGRRHVRERIYLQVAYNDKDWRPLGPKPAHTTGGANQEANFDVDAFKEDYPDTLHTIPAVSRTEVVNWEARLFLDSSRLWTCNVKEWSRRKSRTTREANKAAEASGAEPRTANKSKNDKTSQLGELLAKDPVFKAIAARREKKGPNRAVTAEEQEQLGTRGTLHEMPEYKGGSFCKELKVAATTDRPHTWNFNSGQLPPYFSALKDCRSCTVGAAYVRESSYHRSRTYLACLNRTCFEKKAAAGADEYRIKLEDRKEELFAEDRRAAQMLSRDMETLNPGSLKALASVLVAQSENLVLHNPFGGYYAEQWSFEGQAAARAREILGLPLRETSGGWSLLGDARMEALEGVEPGDVRELVSNLTVHHLRADGRLEAIIGSVPTETAIEPPEFTRAVLDVPSDAVPTETATEPAESTRAVLDVSSDAVPTETASGNGTAKPSRKELGLCANCNNPPVEGETRCDTCKKKRRKGGVVPTQTIVAVKDREPDAVAV